MTVLRTHSKILSLFKTVLFIIFLLIVIPITNLKVEASNPAQTTVNLSISSSNLIIPPKISLINPATTDYLVITVGPVKLDSGQVMNGIRTQITIKIQGSDQEIVIEGVTNSLGILTFNSSQSLASQNLILINGTQEQINQISNQTNISETFAVVFYESTQVQSPSISYSYTPAPSEPDPFPNEPRPNPNPTPSPETPRTGGDTLLISLCIFALIALTAFVVYKNSRTNEFK
jgi:hypothetical protein